MNKLLTILLSFWVLKGFCQPVPKPNVDIQEMINALSPLVTEDLDYEEIYENLYSLYQSPIDLNKAERADLNALFFLSERQINDILEHRNRFGKFLSLYELQTVPSLSSGDIQNLLPFITLSQNFGDISPKGFLMRASEHYLVFRTDMSLEEAKAYKEDKYLGNRQRYYLRYRLSRSKDYSLGFISEKDPGEKQFLDYTAFHFQLQNKGNFKNILVGDYLLQFGQGLIFSAGYVAGKGGEPVYTTRRSNLGAKPYNSLIENGSFRGVTTTYKIGDFELTGMYSLKKRDGSIEDPSDEEFYALQSSGLHRTESEIKNRNSIEEQNIGANILYKKDHIQFGFSALKTSFDKSFENGNRPYKLYNFQGKDNLTLGPNLSVSVQNFNVFAEAARSSSGGYGYIFGLVGSLGKQVEVALNHRNYQPNFHTFYGNAFTESSRTINEKGYYLGLKYIIKKGLEVVAYYDSFVFPWLKYRVDSPTSGHDYLLRINYKSNKKQSMFFAFRGESKARNPSGSNQIIRVPERTRRQSAVLANEISPNMFLKFQTRLQYNGFRQGTLSNGFALIQDIEGKIKRIQLKTRIAYFKTDNYDSRIYAYENDVLYAISFPAYYGSGFRTYFIAKIPLGRKLESWIRIAQTRVSDRETMGSGNDTIDANHKTDVKLQLKYSF